MRIYVREEYFCDEWVFNTLKNKRASLMKKYGLKSLTYSYTMTNVDAPNFSVKVECDVSKKLIADLELLTKTL